MDKFDYYAMKQSLRDSLTKYLDEVRRGKQKLNAVVTKDKIQYSFVNVLTTLLNQIEGHCIYSSHVIFAVNLCVMLDKSMDELSNYCLRR